MLKKIAIKVSSREEEEDEDEGSSSGEREEMESKPMKQDEKMMKCSKKKNIMRYIVFLQYRHHRKQLKVERIKYKEKTKKEQENKESRPKHEAYAIFEDWVSGDEESSSNSSDESSKRFTTRTRKSVSTSSNLCVMARGMGTI
jgi:hypothetical protein